MLAASAPSVETRKPSEKTSPVSPGRSPRNCSRLQWRGVSILARVTVTLGHSAIREAVPKSSSLTCVVHSLADLQEQTKAGFYSELAVIRVALQRLAFLIFHQYVRP